MDNDHGIATISGNAKLGLPLTLPWITSAAPIPLGTTFHSRLCSTSDPWSKVSPFEPQWLENINAEYRNDDGGSASYQSIETSSSNTSAEHLSVAFGITVGCKWLNASVTGGYDKDTLENKDSRKTSTKASFRAGSVIIERRPRLTDDARVILKHQGGLSAFKAHYGDYYVAGYRLGGDAAVLVSESKSSSHTVERLSVEVAAKVVFVKLSKTYEKFFHSASASSSFRIQGFDTLDGIHVRPGIPISLESVGALEQKLGSLEMNCLKLAERVTRRVADKGLVHGEAITFDRLKELWSSNLVVEVILLPISTFREVQSWALSTDVIGF